jgi:hypothetical protein
MQVTPAAADQTSHTYHLSSPRRFHLKWSPCSWIGAWVVPPAAAVVVWCALAVDAQGAPGAVLLSWRRWAARSPPTCRVWLCWRGRSGTRGISTRRRAGGRACRVRRREASHTGLSLQSAGLHGGDGRERAVFLSGAAWSSPKHALSPGSTLEPGLKAFHRRDLNCPPTPLPFSPGW